MANAILRVMQNCYLYPKSHSKKNELVRQDQMLHIRMSATEGWVSIDDALGYLWKKVYGSQPPAVDWAKRLTRPVYIQAYWPPSGAQREEFTAIHMDNLHILFDDPTHMQSDDVINIAISNFKDMVSDPSSVKDATYMVIVGDAKKTASQVRWMRDVRERLQQPDEYYQKKRARDDRHRVHRKKRNIEATVSDDGRYTANTDHISPLACGGVNSPSVHRRLVRTGQLSPCQCSEQPSPRYLRQVQPLFSYGEDYDSRFVQWHRFCQESCSVRL